MEEIGAKEKPNSLDKRLANPLLNSGRFRIQDLTIFNIEIIQKLGGKKEMVEAKNYWQMVDDVNMSKNNMILGKPN